MFAIRGYGLSVCVFVYTLIRVCYITMYIGSRK